MKYKNVNEFQNKYPVRYYLESDSQRIVIEGKTNVLKKPLTNISNLKFEKNTNFSFIINFNKRSPSEDTVEFEEMWTSESYYNILRSAIINRNPFYTTETTPIIDIHLPDIIESIKYQTNFNEDLEIDIDTILGVNINNFTDIEYSIIVKYIDWIVSTTDNELLPTEEIINFNEDWLFNREQINNDENGNFSGGSTGGTNNGTGNFSGGSTGGTDINTVNGTDTDTDINTQNPNQQ